MDGARTDAPRARGSVVTGTTPASSRAFEIVDCDPVPTRLCSRHGCCEVSTWHVRFVLGEEERSSTTIRDALPDPIERLTRPKLPPLRVSTAFGVCDEHRIELE